MDLAKTTARNPTTLSDFVKVAALRNKLEELLLIQTTLTHDAAARVLMALENAIRIGWCIIDIKAELRGGFYVYAEHNFPFSARQAERLMKAAKNFQRDGEYLDFLCSITPELVSPARIIPLVDQIKQTGARHFQDLLVTSGLAPARVAASPSERSVPTGIFKLLRSIDSAVLRFVRVEREFPLEKWSGDDREVVKRKLQPLVEWYEKL